MYPFKRIMIAVDLSEMDKYLLEYISGFCEVIEPTRVYFLNVQKKLNLNTEEREALGFDKNEHVEDIVKDKINEKLNKSFSYKGNFRSKIVIVEGKAAEEVLKWSSRKKIDLIVMGRKATLSGKGIMPQQLAPKVKCSILLVPEKVAKFHFNKIFVPINFSGETKLALEEALDLQRRTEQVLDINCHYAYALPLGHEKSGKTNEEFAEILNTNAAKKFKRLKIELGEEASQLDYSTQLLKDGNVSKALVLKAIELQSDLIIMGAKCKTLAAQLFLGNNTKKMILNDLTIPILIVKEKNETYGFWDFFKNI